MVKRIFVVVLAIQDEQLKLETECLKHERNLKLLEKKLKGHEGNIQAMKSVLSGKEQDLQVKRTLLVFCLFYFSSLFQVNLVYALQQFGTDGWAATKDYFSNRLF